MSILSIFKRKPKSTTLHISQEIDTKPSALPSLDPTLIRMRQEIAEMAKDPKWLAFVEKEKAKQEKNKRKG